MSVDRVSCGGFWGSVQWAAMVALSHRYEPDFRYFHLGFRVARTPLQRVAQ